MLDTRDRETRKRALNFGKGYTASMLNVTALLLRSHLYVPSFITHIQSDPALAFCHNFENIFASPS